MAVIRVPKKLLERCEEFLKKNPDLADNPKDLIQRCGRLGLRYLRQYCSGLKDCPGHLGGGRDPDRGGVERGGLVPVYVPARDFNEIKRLAVDKLGICTSVSNFYMLSAYMVLFGYWSLPPKI